MVILNPPRELLEKYGPLAYVTEEMRKQILAAPYGQFKPRIKALEKEIKVAQKMQKKREGK